VRVLKLTEGGLHVYPDKQIREHIDKMLRNGVTLSSEISRIIERDNGIEIPPHFISEYNYRKRHNLEIREDFFDFEKRKPEVAKNLS
jgi:hypothetical protein